MPVPLAALALKGLGAALKTVPQQFPTFISGVKRLNTAIRPFREGVAKTSTELFFIRRAFQDLSKVLPLNEAEWKSFQKTVYVTQRTLFLTDKQVKEFTKSAAHLGNQIHLSTATAMKFFSEIQRSHAYIQLSREELTKFATVIGKEFVYSTDAAFKSITALIEETPSLIRLFSKSNNTVLAHITMMERGAKAYEEFIRVQNQLKFGSESTERALRTFKETMKDVGRGIWDVMVYPFQKAAEAMGVAIEHWDELYERGRKGKEGERETKRLEILDKIEKKEAEIAKWEKLRDKEAETAYGRKHAVPELERKIAKAIEEQKKLEESLAGIKAKEFRKEEKQVKEQLAINTTLNQIWGARLGIAEKFYLGVHKAAGFGVLQIKVAEKTFEKRQDILQAALKESNITEKQLLSGEKLNIATAQRDRLLKLILERDKAGLVVAEKRHWIRRKWEEAFTAKMMGMAPGTYVTPGAVSPRQMFGGAYSPYLPLGPKAEEGRLGVRYTDYMKQIMGGGTGFRTAAEQIAAGTMDFSPDTKHHQETLVERIINVLEKIYKWWKDHGGSPWINVRDFEANAKLEDIGKIELPRVGKFLKEETTILGRTEEEVKAMKKNLYATYQATLPYRNWQKAATKAQMESRARGARAMGEMRQRAVEMGVSRKDPITIQRAVRAGAKRATIVHFPEPRYKERDARTWQVASKELKESWQSALRELKETLEEIRARLEHIQT